MVLSLLFPIASRLTPVNIAIIDVPLMLEEDVDVFMHFWLVIFNSGNKVDPQCFCCTTLRDVIFMDKSFRECYVTTCTLQYALVCWVTAQSGMHSLLA